jgi:23S rRNA (guanosine2251-2'-O)-methyltransferase
MSRQDIIFGRNNVFEALKKGDQIDKLYIQTGATGGSIGEIMFHARQQKIIVKQVSRIKLDEMCAGLGNGGLPANHQGVIATVPAFSYGEIEDIFALAAQKNEKPFIVILDSIQDPQNLGAIIRSAEVLGAHGVIIGKHRSAGLNAVAYKISCGAAQYIPVVKVTNLSRTLEDLKKRGVWIAATDTEGKPLSKIDLTGPLAIIIGSEGEGVSKLLKQNSDMVITIEMTGNIGSLNASCAASILLYEKKRQELMKK